MDSIKGCASPKATKLSQIPEETMLGTEKILRI
jgi:hypothetical protein